MSHPVPNQGQGGGPRALRVYRVDPGVTARVRILSPVHSVSGVMTHWKNGRSLYCDPGNCADCRQRTRRFWKGYLAVLGYEEPSKKWLPAVLEVTESAELDMRGIIRRGQEWELTRERETKKQRQPVRAVLVGELDLAELPRAFDFLPVLLNLYHETHMAIDVPNPMPGRVLVELEEGRPPLEATAEPSEEPAPAGYFGERVRAAGQGRAYERNGKAHR